MLTRAGRVKPGLRLKLIFGVLAILLPVLGLLLLGFSQERTRQRAEILDRLTLTAQAVAALTDATFDDALAVAQVVASDPAAEALDSARVRPLLERVTSRFPEFANVAAVDAQGSLVGSAVPIEEGSAPPSASDRAYFQQVMVTGQPALSEVQLARVSGIPVVTAAAPIFDDGGTVGAVLVAVELELLAQRLATVQLSPGQAVFIAGPSGDLAYHTQLALLPLAEGLDFANVPQVQLARTGQLVRTTDYTSPITSEVRAAALVPSPRHGWVVGVTWSNHEAFGSVEVAHQRQLLAFTFVALLALSATALLATYLTRPVTQLATHASALGNGALGRRVAIQTGDELEVLGESFNQMAADLESAAREREERLQTEASARKRAAFLAEASEQLSASLDVTVTLERVARLAVPELADWSVVDVLDADGSICLIAACHEDSDKEALIRELRRRYPPDPDAQNGLPLVLRTGEPALYSPIDPAWRAAAARDEEHLRLMEALDARASMCVPLVAHGQTLGALTFVCSESRRSYGPEDLALASELARRCGLALANARLHEQLQESLRMREFFQASLAHDLKSPLTTIKGSMQLLERQVAKLTDQEVAGRMTIRLRQVDSVTDTMAAMLEELEDLARLEAAQPLPLRRTRVDLVALATSQVADLQARSEKHTLRVVAHSDEIVGEWDARRLRRVLDNLIGNAIKYSPEGGGVTVALEKEEADGDAWALMSITDRGIGIPAEDLPSVFQRFHRARNARGRIAGTGLGLAGSRQIIEQHGGGVQIESQEGMGTTVKVRLPLSQSQSSSATPS